MGFWKSYSSFSVHTATGVAGVHSLSRLSKASLTSVCVAPLLHKDKESKKNWIKPRKNKKNMQYALDDAMMKCQYNATYFMFSKLARGWGLLQNLQVLPFGFAVVIYIIIITYQLRELHSYITHCPVSALPHISLFDLLPLERVHFDMGVTWAKVFPLAQKQALMKNQQSKTQSAGDSPCHFRELFLSKWVFIFCPFQENKEGP